MTTRPEISIVLLTDTYATVRNVVVHLRRQSAADRLELVLVAPSREKLELDEQIRSDLHSVEIVESDIDLLPRARAQGIKAAHAPIVVIGETHAYPAPEYAEALIEAHRGPWAVVGPAMLNANPHSMLGWAALFLDYGPWVECKRAGPMQDVPSHNGSYKRRVLLEYGERLEEMLESDPVLNADLRSRGHMLYLEPRAQTFHLNVSQPRVWVTERVVAGRAFAASRGRAWPRQRRLAYAFGAPLIPFVRLVRILRDLRTSGHAVDLLPRLLPALTAALVLSAFGELLGYAFGVGEARRPLYEIELHRERYAEATAS